MDKKDRAILDILQEGIPLVSRPFAEVGRMTGLPEEEVRKRLARLKEKGHLRRLGANFNSRRLGFVTTLCGAIVPPARLEEVAHLVSSYNEVTHCYSRRHRFNLWFTLICKDWEEVEKILTEIRQKARIEAWHFPATRTFKLKATFKL
ncbi:Lrp/AsnC family transcriptional regulator [Thermosulfuriphilus sp.]